MAAEASAATTWPTTAEAAKRLGVGASRVRQLVLDGTLETARIGPLHVINPESLARCESRRNTLPRDVRGRVLEPRGRRRKEEVTAR